jgi:hypothetical protein
MLQTNTLICSDLLLLGMEMYEINADELQISVIIRSHVSRNHSVSLFNPHFVMLELYR